MLIRRPAVAEVPPSAVAPAKPPSARTAKRAARKAAYAREVNRLRFERSEAEWQVFRFLQHAVEVARDSPTELARTLLHAPALVNELEPAVGMLLKWLSSLAGGLSMLYLARITFFRRNHHYALSDATRRSP